MANGKAEKDNKGRGAPIWSLSLVKDSDGHRRKGAHQHGRIPTRANQRKDNEEKEKEAKGMRICSQGFQLDVILSLPLRLPWPFLNGGKPGSSG